VSGAAEERAVRAQARGRVAVGTGVGVGPLEVMTIEFQSTPFRAERFRALYEPAVSRVLAYGASGYVFYRSEDDPDHFVHVSFWEDRHDFDRYWFSHEMQGVRQDVAGLHAQPVLPHWGILVDRG
jgi:quinol monooxygenase YgiN